MALRPRPAVFLFPLALCATLFAWTLPSQAQSSPSIVLATGGTRAELQAAVDSLSGPGVVLIPPGAWELTGTVNVTRSDVTILGAGPLWTRLYRSHDNSDTTLRDAPFIRIQNASGVRVSSIRIDGVPSDQSNARENGIRVENGRDFRVDHCHLVWLGNAAVQVNGIDQGVVDHCEIQDLYKPQIANLGYGVAAYGNGTTQSRPYGTPEAVFVEDCQIHGTRHATASNNGARYVLRYSHIWGNQIGHAIDTHGHEYGSTVGTEWLEVYHVLVDQPIQTTTAVHIRGGGGLIWNNQFNGYQDGVTLTEATDQPTDNIYIWNNTMTPAGRMIYAPHDTTPATGVDGVPSYQAHALAGYTPYTYPHPLVTDLNVDAGPDMTVLAQSGTGEGDVYLDGSNTSIASGSIDSYQWYQGTEPVSSCARDRIKLPVGTHLLLLKATGDNQKSEYDTAVVNVVAAGPLQSSTTWNSTWFAPFEHAGTVEFTVTPSAAPMDGYVAIAGRHPVAAHEDNAIQVRFNSNGVIDARNGTAYAADRPIPYQAGHSYRVKVIFDVGTQHYDVEIDGTRLASGFAFRHPESALWQLNSWHYTGGLEVKDIAFAGEQAQPDPACRTEEPDAGPEADAPTTDAPEGPDARDSASGQEASVESSVPEADATEGEDGGAELEAGSEGTPSAGSDDGCGCRTAGRRKSDLGAWLLGIGLVLGALKARFRRS